MNIVLRHSPEGSRADPPVRAGSPGPALRPASQPDAIPERLTGGAAADQGVRPTDSPKNQREYDQFVRRAPSSPPSNPSSPQCETGTSAWMFSEKSALEDTMSSWDIVTPLAFSV